MIDVVIPVRNKELSRLNKVISRLNHNLVSSIIVVDYGSDKEIEKDELSESSKIKIIRYDKTREWNKAHAINIGFKYSESEYIMTLDADILLGPNFFDRVYEYLDENIFLYSNNVRRIKKEDLYDDWNKCIENSTPWNDIEDPLTKLHHTATGGFQIFPRWWFEKIRGIDENFVFYGGMDNITIIEAKREGLDVVVLNETILHLEHPNQKEDNLPEDIRNIAKWMRYERHKFMRYILRDDYKKNEGFWGSLSKPNWPIYLKKKEDYKKMDKGTEFSRDTRIMIVVINNKSYLPRKFVQSLMDLVIYTRSIFPNTSVNYVSACQVNHMRNIAVQKAIEHEQDYLVQLDDDHTYPQDFILRLMGRNKDFITGCTKGRVYPHKPTQFYKFKEPLKQEDNYVYTDGEDGVIPIEVSGPVGMLMKVDALKQIEFPYYKMDYSYYVDGKPNPLGGDYYFCSQLKEKGFKLYLDTSLEFPHFIEGEISGHGKEPEFDID